MSDRMPETDPLDALLEEADKYVALGWYASPERYAAAIRELRARLADTLRETGIDREELCQERDSLRTEVEQARTACVEVMAQREELRAELEALRNRMAESIANREQAERVRQRLDKAMGAKS